MRTDRISQIAGISLLALVVVAVGAFIWRRNGRSPVRGSLRSQIRGETTEHAYPPRLEDEGQSGG